MLEARLRKNLDLLLLALTYLLAAFGVVILYSVSRGGPTPFHVRQMAWIALGTAGLIGAALSDYHAYARFVGFLYALNLLLLTLVILPHIGQEANGAARWIRVGGFPFQPSEFAKLAVILTLAVFLARRRQTIRQSKTLLCSFLYVALPVVLIFKQPDLGTAMVIVAIWFGMTYMAGARLRHLAAFALAGLLLGIGMWHSGRILKDYQKNRLIAFIHPDADPKETGYHVIQARIAIGSGGVWGKGLLRSTQVRGGYIPERQTDFVFTDIGEELGFVGAGTLCLLYMALLLRAGRILMLAEEDLLGQLIGAGILTMLAFHVLVNIGMNVGLMPVAGVPLPLISAGGSNMVVTLASIGLLQSIALHRHPLLF